MISQELLDVLVCPACKGDLLYEGERLICRACRLAYPIKDEIPIMLIDEAQPLEGKTDTESGEKPNAELGGKPDPGSEGEPEHKSAGEPNGKAGPKEATAESP